VFQVGQRGQRVTDDAVRTTALDVGDHGDATGIPLGCRVVQTLPTGQRGKKLIRADRSCFTGGGTLSWGESWGRRRHSWTSFVVLAVLVSRRTCNLRGGATMARIIDVTLTVTKHSYTHEIVIQAIG
jgi:hypothetical protein